VVAEPGVGLLFLVPGVGETLRVNGTASVTDDPSVLDACAVDGRRPRVAVVVEVTECYIHGAKAVRRAGLWDAESWAAADERPDGAAIIGAHVGLPDAAAVRDALEAGYERTMWEVGGEP
jgi:predicted pyridoxine 5'-phosphate oxidase superfamily flavin-nucleotide-binding protein